MAEQVEGKENQNEMQNMVQGNAEENSPPEIYNMDDILRHLKTGPWNLYIAIVCSFCKTKLFILQGVMWKHWFLMVDTQNHGLDWFILTYIEYTNKAKVDMQGRTIAYKKVTEFLSNE